MRRAQRVNTLGHKTNIIKLYKTLKSITLSTSSPLQTHVGITSADDVSTQSREDDHFSRVRDLRLESVGWDGVMHKYGPTAMLYGLC